MKKLDFSDIKEPNYLNMGKFYGDVVYMTADEIRLHMSINIWDLYNKETYFVGRFEGKNIYMTSDQIKKYTGRDPLYTITQYSSVLKIEDNKYNPHEPDPNTIINPTHYTQNKIECIQVTELFNFCLGNVIKYVWRAGLKPGNSRIDDLKKALWYLNREIAMESEKEE
jgi:hypothetical protein